ncbi:MAG: SUF system NifU family Fe-S cluster assembly protein [Gammaproteobacteria bacterium]|nr:MAG: SUF system NifU family Fe-S cluster assembly protein [Gammaproteobacteria bacterium]
MDLYDLYQEVIVDHNRSPRNFGKPEGYNRIAEGFNPLCGDRLTLYLRVDDTGTIEDIAFEGEGCAISVASASLMTECLKGQPVSKAEALFGSFHKLVTGGESEPGVDLGKLAALAGVREFPSRVKCATLCWHALKSALNEK